MILNHQQTHGCLKEFEFQRLFIELLGWDRHDGTTEVQVGDQTYTLRSFAEKRGVQIFECQPDNTGAIPDYKVRRKIEKAVTKSAYEHLIVFVDGDSNYLQNRLQAVQQRKGKGKFLTFYRYFLLALFHEGFSKQPQQRELDPELAELLGEVPYLNGGLFELHELEDECHRLGRYGMFAQGHTRQIQDDPLQHIFDSSIETL